MIPLRDISPQFTSSVGLYPTHPNYPSLTSRCLYTLSCRECRCHFSMSTIPSLPLNLRRLAKSPQVFIHSPVSKTFSCDCDRDMDETIWELNDLFQEDSLDCKGDSRRLSLSHQAWFVWLVDTDSVPSVGRASHSDKETISMNSL